MKLKKCMIALFTASMLFSGCSCSKNNASENETHETDNNDNESVSLENNWNSDEITPYATIGIHDPSVFYDPVSEEYFSYGSHIIAGNSKDLISWQYISGSSVGYSTSNRLFTKHYLEEFKEIYDWLGSDVKEGIWALDVTYSEEAKKAGNDPYLMYVTVCNSSFKSAIALATSDSPAGPFSYKGMIVCSDYTEAEVNNGKTNLLEVLGADSSKDLTSDMRNYYFKADSSAYKNSLPDCIDPAPFYDHEGNLYLTYGSFTCKGGLRVLKLDSKTGLRSNDNYEFKADGLSDPYFGQKIANSNGEGPYILKVESSLSSTGYYYFLFWSQGNLRSTGGYNMRMFRSEYPDRGFVDMAGNSALSNIEASNLGVRIMDNFKFTTLPYPSCANGGNSAIVTSDKRIFLHYHSKSSNSAAYGENGFIIKSNQMFLNEDGWLVTSPFKYNGETLSPISSDICGDYEFIRHRLEYYKDPADYSLNYVDSTVITLNPDGTISGNATGTYKTENNYITLTIDNTDYKGVIFEGCDEDSKISSILFTASGNDNRTVWGQKIYHDTAKKLALDISKIEIPKKTTESFSLPHNGFFSSDIVWSSDSDAIKISGDTASVTSMEEDVTVKLTATLTLNGETKTKEYDVTVPMEEFNIPSAVTSDTIELPLSTKSGKKIIWTSSDMSVINTDTFKVFVPKSGSHKVMIKGTIEGSSRVIEKEISVMSVPVNVVYTENYDDLTSINAGFEGGLWYSKNAAEFVSLKSNGSDKYLEFAPGNQNSRGAVSTFALNQKISENYIVEFDTMLCAGDNQTTELVLKCDNATYLSNVVNDGISSGYVFKMHATNSELWSINDTDTVTIPKNTWVHISVFVSSETATVSISDKAGNILYSGMVNTNNATSVSGFYIRGGRYNSLTALDNIKIKY